jgi:hypothetical protein
MSLLLITGGIIGIAAQLVNIGVADTARPFICDCGYRAEEVIGLEQALRVGFSIQNWTLIGSLSLVAVGVALAGRVVEVSSTWRTVSNVIVVAVLLAAAIRVVASFVFIEAFDPFQVSNLILAISTGILVPVWVVMLARGVPEPMVEADPAAV